MFRYICSLGGVLPGYITQIEKVAEAQLLLEAITGDRCLVTYDNIQAHMKDVEVTINDSRSS